MSYYIGQVVQVTGKITSKKTGEAVDPTKVVGTLIPPKGETESLTPTKVSKGEYEFKVPVTEVGNWELIVDGIGGEDTASHTKWRAEKRNAPRPS